MRTVMIAAMALGAAGAASGQGRMTMPGPGPDAASPAPPRAPMVPKRGQHWGGRVGGRWSGGVRAPGGYAAYRPLSRGYVLPSYWNQPGFVVGDWSLYGLQQPPSGYWWTRYYDDAVLVDARGSVVDTNGGVDWDRYDLDYAGSDGDTGRYADVGVGDRGYADDRSAGAGYPPPPGYGERRSSGVGGAVVGGALGAGAGALIAGRHDKVAGALIGAGAGAATGYAIDRSSGRGRYAPPPPPAYAGTGADYPPPGGYADDRGPYRDGPRAYRRYDAPVVVGGGTTVTTTSGGYGGSYYGPGTVTTVTVASAPVVTTTTEIVEDSVTYTRAVRHRTYHRRVYRHLPTCGCRVR